MSYTMEEENNGLNDVKSLLAQKKVIQTIIDKGFKFQVEYTVKVREKGLKGFFKPKVYETRTEEFILKEPTLNTFDRATVVKLRMKPDVAKLDKEGADVKSEIDKMAQYHSRDMAECLAIMVLGEKYFAVEGGDDEELERLTNLFYRTIRPSQYYELETFINAAMNYADFANSMRLMMMSITTTPTARIE